MASFDNLSGRKFKKKKILNCSTVKTCVLEPTFTNQAVLVFVKWVPKFSSRSCFYNHVSLFVVIKCSCLNDNTVVEAPLMLAE